MVEVNNVPQVYWYGIKIIGEYWHFFQEVRTVNGSAWFFKCSINNQRRNQPNWFSVSYLLFNTKKKERKSPVFIKPFVYNLQVICWGSQSLPKVGPIFWISTHSFKLCTEIMLSELSKPSSRAPGFLWNLFSICKLIPTPLSTSSHVSPPLSSSIPAPTCSFSCWHGSLLLLCC